MVNVSTKAMTGRRAFLRGLAATGSATIVGSGVAGGSLKAWALPPSEVDTVLVEVFLRGGADSLNMVVPHGDPDYYRQRGDYGVATTDMTDLDGFFGLSHLLGDLLPLWESGELSFINAVGSHHPTRSHFVAQPNMQTGLDSGGWMERLIAASRFADSTAGLSVGDRTSPSLTGPLSGAVVDTIEGTVQAGMAIANIRPAIESMYTGAGVPASHVTAVRTAMTTIDELSVLNPTPGVFPTSDLGQDLREAASLIRADIGVRCISVDNAGWDHHIFGEAFMAQYAPRLGAALRAFFEDLGSHRKRVLVCVSSEFGRMVVPNGATGTDHGHGGLMMVMGEPVAGHSGGRVLVPGGWPGLAEENLYDGRDLAITTDFRSVYAELAERHLLVSDTQSIFPGLEREEVGVLARAGDVNLDGTANIVDALLIARHSVGTIADGGPTDLGDGEIHAKAGDYNLDGRTDIADALLVAQCGVGVTTSGYCR